MNNTLIILLISTCLYPQISGTVIDYVSNQPLAGVNITGGNTGTAANENG